jgi:hypothetical protein
MDVHPNAGATDSFSDGIMCQLRVKHLRGGPTHVAEQFDEILHGAQCDTVDHILKSAELVHARSHGLARSRRACGTVGGTVQAR